MLLGSAQTYLFKLNAGKFPPEASRFFCYEKTTRRRLLLHHVQTYKPTGLMIKLHNSTDGQFYFTVNARNGKVLVTSETYKTQQSCKKAIKSLQKGMAKTWLSDAGIKTTAK